MHSSRGSKRTNRDCTSVEMMMISAAAPVLVATIARAIMLIDAGLNSGTSGIVCRSMYPCNVRIWCRSPLEVKRCSACASHALGSFAAIVGAPVATGARPFCPLDPRKQLWCCRRTSHASERYNVVFSDDKIACSLARSTVNSSADVLDSAISSSNPSWPSTPALARTCRRYRTSRISCTSPALRGTNTPRITARGARKTPTRTNPDRMPTGQERAPQGDRLAVTTCSLPTYIYSRNQPSQRARDPSSCFFFVFSKTCEFATCTLARFSTEPSQNFVLYSHFSAVWLPRKAPEGRAPESAPGGRSRQAGNARKHLRWLRRGNRRPRVPQQHEGFPRARLAGRGRSVGARCPCQSCTRVWRPRSKRSESTAKRCSVCVRMSQSK